MGVKFPGKKRYLHLVGVGLRRVSDFLENSVTNVTLLKVTTGGWVSSFQKQLLHNT